MLAAGEWRAALRPEVGGALASLTFAEMDILRPMPAEAGDPLSAACFPLVPYANRIRDGRFAFAGREVRLPANFPPERHSIHGLGWQRPWQVEADDGREAVMADTYSGDERWPWSYRAEQRISLDDAGCCVALTLTNTSPLPMPAGLGLHPYFRRRPGTRLSFASSGVLLSDAELLPTGEVAPPDRFAAWAEGATLPRELVDHCHVGWSGRLTIDDDLGRIALSASGAPHLHLYAPPGGAELCCEPVSHTPDAPNRAPAEMTVLPPGGAMRLELRITASR